MARQRVGQVYEGGWGGGGGGGNSGSTRNHYKSFIDSKLSDELMCVGFRSLRKVILNSCQARVEFSRVLVFSLKYMSCTCIRGL